MRKRMTSLLLTLAMVLGMLPAMSITAAAAEPGKTADNPVVCTNFDEFKAAMQGSAAFVKLAGGYFEATVTGSSIQNAVYTNGNKTLIVEGYNKFVPAEGDQSQINSLIAVGLNHNLTIQGTGQIEYWHENFLEAGAVICLEATGANLTVNGEVTIKGYHDGSNVHGRAIYATTGTVTINGGKFIGDDARNEGYTAESSVVTIKGDASLKVNGGTFMTGGSTQCDHGVYINTTGDVQLRAGTFQNNGITIDKDVTIADTGYFTGATIKTGIGYGETSVLSDWNQNVSVLKDKTVVLEYPYFIRDISATVTKPVDGASPVFSATAGDDSYTVTVYKWYDGGTAESPNTLGVMNASDTFVAGNPYVVEVTFTPKEGYVILSSFSAAINGVDAVFAGSNAVTGAVYYRVAFTAAEKKYSGTGSYNDPAVCTNFEAFKQAMENPSIQYVKLVGDSTPGFYMKDTIPVNEDGVLRDAVLCDGPNKVLILEGNTQFEGPPTCNSLINLSVNNRLTITGNGTLAYCPHYFHRESAVVNLEGDSAKLTVEDGVRLRGFAEVGNTHGRAIYARSNSTVIINGGILYGEDALTTNADEIFTSAVTITGHANLIVNGGYISTTREEDKQCESALYLDTTGQVILREGEILEAGIVVVPNTLTINGSAYFSGSRVYTKSGSEWIEPDRTQPVSILEGTNVKMSFTQFIDAATVTVTDPMSGQAPNTTAFTVGDSTYTVDKITWYNGGTVDNPGTKMTSSDTFEAGQTYIVDVRVKPTKDSGYVIRNGCTVTINGVPTDKAFYRDGITGAGNYRVALTCNKSLITSLSATGLPTLPAAGTKGEGVVNVPLTVTDPGYTATFTGWLRKTTLGDRQGYSVMTASNTFEAGETYFAEVMIVPVDGNLISTNATATVDGNTAVYTSGTVDGKRSYVVPFTVPNEEEETAYNITCVNCRVLNDKTTATAGTKLTFVSPSDTYGDGGVLSKWVVTVGDGEPTVVDGATQFALQYVMPAANLKVEAVYSKAVTFMDGENTIVKKTVDTTTNKVTSWPTNPTKEGYVFIGWYTKANGGIQKSQDAEFEANTTLYAHWDKVISTVKITNVTLPRVGVELSAAGATSETAGIKVDSTNGVWYYSIDDGATWTKVTDTLEAKASDKYKFEVPFSIKEGYVLSASAGCSISYSKASISPNGVRKYIATLECEASPASVTNIQFYGGYSIDGELKNESPIGGVPEGTNVTLTPTDLDRCRENGLTDTLNLLKGKHFAGWKSWDGAGYYVVDLTENPDGSVSFTMPTAAAQAGYSEGICIVEIWKDHSGGTATCTHQAICEDCGEAYGALDPNNHSGANVWEITADTHKAFCQDCGAAKMAAAEDHDFGGDNICDTCGYDCSEKTYTVTVIDGSATPASATAGTTVTLKADEPADGMKFKEWVVVSGSVTINSDNTFTMPESNVVIMASYVPKVVIPGTFAVTVNGSYASATGAGAYAPDEVVSIHAGTRSNYTFAGWTSSDVAIAGASNADASFIMPYNDVTVTANWTYNGSSGGSSGGGVSTYAITVDSAKNGDVTSSHKSAAKGTTVTLTVEPDKGYTLETITATDASGNKLKLTEKDGKYTFTMPASKVTVKATFMEDNSMLNFFVDVPADAYYYDAVLWAAEKGITGGVDATHFAPNATCTRAQAVTFLWRAAGSPAPKSSDMPFTDVAEGSYYYDAVLWAVENGITKGTSDTTFTPNAKCTRAQIVTFLWRSQKSPASDSVNPFTDVAADAYYNTAVLWAAENGITGGTSATTFSPNNDCTRAQIVTFLFRCLGK